MEVKIKDLEKSQKQIDIEISKEELDAFIERAYAKLAANLEMKGFRKGKVPRDIIEKNIPKENVLIEAGDLAVQDTYKRAVLENNLEPISSPEVTIKKMAVGSPLSFEAKVSVMPQVNLSDYKKIAKSVKKQEIKIEEKEIEAALKWVQRSRAKFTVKNEPCQNGDFVEIEYSSKDIPEINPAKKDAFILGEGHFIPGFEGVLLGMKASEEKNNIEMEIPKEHSFKKIAGKKVSFDIKLNSVQKMEFPEITDEFAKTLGNFKNLEEFKNSVREGIKGEKEYQRQQKARNEILDRISDEMKIDIPDILIQKEQEHMFEHFKEDVSSKLGISYDDYLKKIGKEEKDIKEMLLSQAQKKVKNFLVLREIGKKENIEVSDQEAREEAIKMGLDPEKLKDYTKEVIRTEKIFQLLENLTK